MTTTPRGFAGALLIIAIAAVVLLGGGYLYEQHKTSNGDVASTTVSAVATSSSQGTTTATQTQTTAQAPAQVQAWTTYTNTQFGFTVSYPAAWGKPTSEVRYGTTVITLTPGFAIVIGLIPGQADVPATYDELHASFKAETVLGDGVLTSDTTIGGRPAFTVIDTSKASGGIIQVYAYTHYSTAYNGFENLFEVTYGLNPTRNLNQSDVDLFTKVLGTITFTK